MFGTKHQNLIGQRRVRLLVEELEGRWLLSKFAWAPRAGAPNLDFHTIHNWVKWDPAEVAWIRTAGVPGSRDEIWLTDSLAIAGENNDQPQNFNADIMLTRAGGWAVNSITFETDYTAVMTLRSDFYVTGNAPGSSPDAFVTMNSATIAGAGGNLILDSGTRFEWSGGTLRDLTVFVRPESVPATRAEVVVLDKAAGAGPLMLSAAFDVEGTLTWQSGNVNSGRSGANKPASAIHVRAGNIFGGRFDIQAGNTWGTNSDDLVVTNRGTVTKYGGGSSIINGSYTTHARTVINGGILRVNGEAEQSEAGAVFALVNGSTIKLGGANHVLGIRGGRIVGNGTVDGNLHLGNHTGGGSVPIIAPGDWITYTGIGRIDVTENFHMYAGETQIDVDGNNLNNRDLIAVQGYAIITGTLTATMTPARATYPADTRIVFLTTAGGRPPWSDYTGRVLPPGLRTNANNNEYWLEPATSITGKVGKDTNGNGVFEPDLGEPLLAGVKVVLLDENGVALGDPVFTDVNGKYDLGGAAYGNYKVRFIRPSELRPVQPGATPNESADSDYEFDTILAPVALTEAAPAVTNTADALFRPLTAENDAFTTAYRTTVGGNVLLNDPPADGDTLTVTLAPDTGPAGGTLDLNADGSFAYTPHAGFWGTDSFTYVVTDFFGHTATAVVTITVIPPPVTVTGRVWHDQNADGVQDAGEPDADYAVVSLYDAAGNVVETLGVTGSFAFTVPAGTYRISVMQASYNSTGQDQGDDERDSDVDAYGFSGWFGLAPDETIDLDAGLVPMF